MAGIRDNHEDILDPRRKGSDIRFALQTLRGVPEYKYINRQTPKEVKEQVLKSQRLRHVIEQVRTKMEALVFVLWFLFLTKAMIET